MWYETRAIGSAKYKVVAVNTEGKHVTIRAESGKFSWEGLKFEFYETFKINPLPYERPAQSVGEAIAVNLKERMNKPTLIDRLNNTRHRV